MTHDWTAITVTYNSAGALRRCWGGFDGSFRWVVVDNASTDDSVAVAEELGATVFRQPSNVGFSRANNRALRQVETQFVAFVNPDVTVASGSLHRLEATACAGAVVAPQLTFPDGSVQPNGRGLPFVVDKLAHRGVRVPFARVAEYAPAPGADLLPVDWVMGAAVAGTTATMRRLGGWDGRYFIYYEDHELGLRAWSRGVPVLVDPNVRWVHEWSRDTARWSPLHWRYEIGSAARFFAAYPLLVMPWRGPAGARYGSRTAHARQALQDVTSRMDAANDGGPR
ncbi:glycosyltransferase family 2 protein [Cellulomonas fimi]|uniref:Glycosyl transferase family 2 n=1 Tax=Cellulomonas fimi (strain ATCC 484 / DSM 20113 / JCM 1341 / CCUG 24087 / LMG 16345 / NBRC 15513 / NCIMB 8980 / NCTC 7547 / NRS-133) TaxID=590998 RepID=F4GZE6_CELFA|nr:glycosyltransferase [Cellulomonas fimi]AEE44867.1 glycosyl transferase family 2 [Cellulomonas fimi ATCC 484]NNH08102.1 glycosyltransferase [Cellulomonas fimi]VEH27528.1 dTDP-Rha:alpha-D-GlcNAc-pyrophosphate polyprenol, alpha-3-L-rhamnosyltransferase [Cellulomonas fimi]